MISKYINVSNPLYSQSLPCHWMIKSITLVNFKEQFLVAFVTECYCHILRIQRYLSTLTVRFQYWKLQTIWIFCVSTCSSIVPCYCIIPSLNHQIWKCVIIFNDFLLMLLEKTPVECRSNKWGIIQYSSWFWCSTAPSGSMCSIGLDYIRFMTTHVLEDILWLLVLAGVKFNPCYKTGSWVLWKQLHKLCCTCESIETHSELNSALRLLCAPSLLSKSRLPQLWSFID